MFIFHVYLSSFLYIVYIVFILFILVLFLFLSERRSSGRPGQNRLGSPVLRPGARCQESSVRCLSQFQESLVRATKVILDDIRSYYNCIQQCFRVCSSDDKNLGSFICWACMCLTIWTFSRVSLYTTIISDLRKNSGQGAVLTKKPPGLVFKHFIQSWVLLAMIPKFRASKAQCYPKPEKK